MILNAVTSRFPHSVTVSDALSALWSQGYVVEAAERGGISLINRQAGLRISAGGKLGKHSLRLVSIRDADAEVLLDGATRQATVTVHGELHTAFVLTMGMSDGETALSHISTLTGADVPIPNGAAAPIKFGRDRADFDGGHIARTSAGLIGELRSLAWNLSSEQPTISLPGSGFVANTRGIESSYSDFRVDPRRLHINLGGSSKAVRLSALLSNKRNRQSRGSRSAAHISDQHAGWSRALEDAKDSETWRRLVDQSRQEGDVSLGVADLVIPFLRHSSPRTRRFAIQALGEIGLPRPSALVEVLPLLDDADRAVRFATFVALSQIGGNGAVDALVRQLESGNGERRRWAAHALGVLGQPQAVEPLVRALSAEEDKVCEETAAALGALGDPRAVEPLCALLQTGSAGIKWRAAQALGCIGDPRAGPLLRRALEAGDLPFWVRDTIERVSQELSMPHVEGPRSFPEPWSYSIDSDRCEGVGDCVSVCPVACIHWATDESGEHMMNARGDRYTFIDPTTCINCGACLSVCPIEQAIIDEWQPFRQRA